MRQLLSLKEKKLFVIIYRINMIIKYTINNVQLKIYCDYWIHTSVNILSPLAESKLPRSAMISSLYICSNIHILWIVTSWFTMCIVILFRDKGDTFFSHLRGMRNISVIEKITHPILSSCSFRDYEIICTHSRKFFNILWFLLLHLSFNLEITFIRELHLSHLSN